MKKNCKKALCGVESADGGTASSVVNLQPKKKRPNAWRRFMGDWHLDKRIPITLIITIIIQTMGVTWWASNVEARVSEQQAKFGFLADYMQRQNENDKQVTATLARLDERVKQQGEVLASIDRKMK